MHPAFIQKHTVLRTLRNFASAAMMLLVCVFLLLYRHDAQNGVFTGVYTCINTLVPSLFPFVLLACLLTRSRAAALLFRPLSPVMRHVFHLPACAAPALFFGLIAGYPTGAKITASLYTDGKLTREQAARLLCFCTAPGYAFTAYAGTRLPGGERTGILLFFACLLAPLCTGMILARFAPKPEKGSPQKDTAPGSFTEAVRDGVSAMVSLCAFVVVFSAVLSIVNGSGLFRAASALLSRLGITVPAAGAYINFFLEVTAGISHCAYWHLAPAVSALGLGFAGLCIHLQIFSFFRRTEFPLPKLFYVFTRLINALLCAAVYLTLAYFFPASAETSVSGAPLQASLASGSAPAGAALLLLSVFFLLSCMRRDHLSDRDP